MSKPLAGKKILVTRPQQQAHDLCARIEALGGQALAFPTLVITPHTVTPEVAKQAATCDRLIFISANAVHFAVTALPMPTLQHTACVAIGQATLRALQQLQLDAIVPPPPYNSEALLSMPEFSAVQGQRMAIIKGVDGRRLLQDTLTERGAHILEVDVYQRRPPEHADPAIVQLIQQLHIDYILISSQQSLEHLLGLIGGAAPLRRCRMIVGSKRQAEYAEQLGCACVWSIKTPNDAAYVEQLRQCVHIEQREEYQ